MKSGGELATAALVLESVRSAAAGIVIPSAVASAVVIVVAGAFLATVVDAVSVLVVSGWGRAVMFVAITGRVALVLTPRLAAVTLITGALAIGTLVAGTFVIGAFVIGASVAGISTVTFVHLATVVDAVSVLVVAGWGRAVIIVAIAGRVTVSFISAVATGIVTGPVVLGVAIVAGRLVVRSIIIVWRVAYLVVVAVRRAVICGVPILARDFVGRLFFVCARTIRRVVRGRRVRFDFWRRLRLRYAIVGHRWERAGRLVRCGRVVRRARSLEYVARVRRGLARAHCRNIAQDQHDWLRRRSAGAVLNNDNGGYHAAVATDFGHPTGPRD